MKMKIKRAVREWVAFKIAAIYGVFSALWILLSDQMLYLMVKDPQIMTKIQMLKGWMFILISAGIIFLLLRREIQKLRLSDTALQESEEKYRFLLNSSKDAVFIHQPSNDGRLNPFIEVNEVACQTYGYTKEEFMALSPLSLVAQESLNDLGKHVKTVFKEQSNHFEIYHQHKNGRVFPVEVNAYLFEFKDKQTVLSIVRNIQKRKDTENELRQTHKMESIGRLAGGIAHEFNNILGIIIGNAELALDDTPDWNPSHDNIQKIKTAGLRAKDVVRQLLSFSRKTEKRMQPVNVVEVVDESLKLIRSSIPASIEIRTRLNHADIIISADATQIHQVIINLCTNAAHAMPEGGILEVELKPLTVIERRDKPFQDLQPGNYMALIVKDSGKGIASMDREKIFDPYFTTKEIGKGTGMGLAVVHGIIKNHRGRIIVDSEPDKGSTFKIILPVLDKNHVPFKESIVETADEKGNETLLFVDDEKPLVEMAKSILEKLGYQVMTATNPNQALALFEQHHLGIDLVISDMTMPEMSGVQLAQKLRDIQPHIPIIICTGHSSLLDESHADSLGLGFTMKPITRNEISRLIRKTLAQTTDTVFH